MVNPKYQEWLEIGVRGMASQEWVPAKNSVGSCFYFTNGENPRRCVIGHVLHSLGIPDNELQLLRGSIDTLIESGKVPLSHEDTEFLMLLQKAHDTTPLVLYDHSSEPYVKVAEHFGLSFPQDLLPPDPAIPTPTAQEG